MQTMRADTLFVDTNVLLTATDESRRQHADALRFLNAAGEEGRHLAASGQVLREYLVVATRPVAVNGLGLSTADALSNVSAFLRLLVVCDESEKVSRQLRALVQRHGLRGKCIHDANVVATMKVHGIPKLVTQNAADFKAFADIETADASHALRSLTSER